MYNFEDKYSFRDKSEFFNFGSDDNIKSNKIDPFSGISISEVFTNDLKVEPEVTEILFDAAYTYQNARETQKLYNELKEIKLSNFKNIKSPKFLWEVGKVVGKVFIFGVHKSETIRGGLKTINSAYDKFSSFMNGVFSESKEDYLEKNIDNFRLLGEDKNFDDDLNFDISSSEPINSPSGNSDRSGDQGNNSQDDSNTTENTENDNKLGKMSRTSINNKVNLLGR